MRETIGSGSMAKVLDFIYDESGRAFALRYSTNGGSSFTTYYYVLNLQGDVVKLIQPNSSGTSYTTYAAYTYDAWGNILTQSGTMASVSCCGIVALLAPARIAPCRCHSQRHGFR